MVRRMLSSSTAPNGRLQPPVPKTSEPMRSGSFFSRRIRAVAGWRCRHRDLWRALWRRRTKGFLRGTKSSCYAGPGAGSQIEQNARRAPRGLFQIGSFGTRNARGRSITIIIPRNPEFPPQNQSNCSIVQVCWKFTFWRRELSARAAFFLWMGWWEYKV